MEAAGLTAGDIPRLAVSRLEFWSLNLLETREFLPIRGCSAVPRKEGTFRPAREVKT